MSINKYDPNRGAINLAEKGDVDSLKSYVDAQDNGVKSEFAEADAEIQSQVTYIDGTTIPSLQNSISTLISNLSALSNNVYTQAQVQALISEVMATVNSIPVWNEVYLNAEENLPTVGANRTVYFKVEPRASGTTDRDYCSEYIYINGAWERIGRSEADLDKFVTDSEAISFKEACAGYVSQATSQASAASGSATLAGTYSGQASEAANKAHRWADGDVGTSDQPDSTHNAKYFSVQSGSYATQSSGYKDLAKGYMEQAETFKNQAQAAKDELIAGLGMSIVNGLLCMTYEGE